MIRDPGALQNLGHGVTSRDVPFNEDESEGVAPNSGYVSRALNNHPITRFFATTAATMVVAGVLSKMTKQGGLKLTQFFEKKMGENQVASRAIYTAKQIRQQLDELQGVNRYVEGEEDVYRKLVFGDKTTGLTSGYDGVSSERFGFSFLTSEERRLSGSGLLGEPTVTWHFRDELQQRLIRAGRRLPYELPAFYAAQKGIVDPLFGEREQGQRKVKWYNPVDVLADFTKESVKTVATMILPFEGAGAGLSSARSGLHSLQYSMADIRNLGPAQQKMHKSFVNVSEVLSQVGHDFATVTNKVLKKSSQASGAFNAATLEFTNQQQGLVQTWRSLRKGVKAAGDAERAKDAAYIKIKSTEFFALFRPPSEEYSNLLDLIPAFRGVRSAVSEGKQEYKLLGKVRNAMDDALANNKIIAEKLKISENTLERAIGRIQSQHSSRLSRLASGLRILGGGGPDNAQLSTSQFGQMFQVDAFKDLLEAQLIHKGVDQKSASLFISHINVPGLPKRDTSLDKLITIGKTAIIPEGHTSADVQDLFFGEILKRFSGIKGSEGLIKTSGFTADALRDAVERAQGAFLGRDFQIQLNNALNSNWNKFYRDDLHNVASSILKPKKALYQDFIGEPTAAKLEFLQRKTAETLGIKLIDSNGKRLSNELINKELRKRAIDPLEFTDLRAFLIKNRQMTSGIFRGGYNLFGMQQVTIDEAQDRGMFKHLRPEDQQIVRDIAGRTAINDPVSNAIGLSRLDGVYKTKTGELLDFTSIKSTFGRIGNFFASEFKIPLLGFNPTDLFGYNSYSEMARRSPIQYVSSRSVQPFVKGQESRADFYLWHKTRGVKGSLTAYGHDELTGRITTETLKGSYRAIATNSTDLYSRHTRYASAAEGKTTEEIRGRTGSSLLNKLLGDDAALRFKRKMAIDAEQPNSLWQQLARFRRRDYDLDNPITMSKLLRGETITEKVGQSVNRYRLDVVDDALRVVDETGKIVPKFTEADILRGFHNLRKESFQYGMPVKVMKYLEENNPELFTALGGQRVSGMIGEIELSGLANQLIEAQSVLTRELNARGIDPTEVLASGSRMKSILNQANLNSSSMLSQRSPTISTRLDELKNEIFRYIAQTNQLALGQRPDQIFTEIQSAIQSLYASGAISASQRIEAQAAGLSTMFNINAFSTFKRADTGVVSARKAAVSFFRTSTADATGGIRSANSNVSDLFNPFAQGEIAQVSSSIRKRFSPLLSPLKRKFGTAGYSPDELSIDPLGSGQNLTMVPTLGTAFQNNARATVKSALGIDTYSNPEGFSTGSIPISQGVERLNRYFGTLGMQLDVSSFKGPLDLFARGMVGKRVLPLYAAGVTAMTVDRTLGGMVGPKDDRGERVYAPFFLGQIAKGGVEVSAAAAGLVPGGMSYAEKREQLVEGEVPIRQGRFWPLGNTPFKGGKIMYYRPSWYRKLQGGAMFTSDTYGSPAEKFLFYNDISPLRAFDPYRFERKHYMDRPYPVTGEYFTGPFGPLTSIGNLTLGRILKPQKMMHEEELSQGLASYSPAGQFGAYDATAYAPMSGVVGGITSGGGGGGGFALGMGGSTFGQGGGSFGFGVGGMQSSQNARLSSMAGSTNMAGGMVTSSLGQINASYSALSYGPPKVSKVMNPRVVAAGTPIRAGSTEFQSGELGYRTQEMLGIYGFAFGSLRQGLGFGQSDFEPQRSVLQSASKAYGTSRAFWDLNLGGLGDVPLPAAEGIGNIEFSEIVRRFIPKERTGVDYINPIQNQMGQQYPFLPGPEYYTNFRTGDPFTKVQEGEIRLPGVGYERFNRLHPDENGRYGLIDQLNILADVAPYSQQFKSINSKLNKTPLTPEERIKVAEIRQQAEGVTQRNEFDEYKYRGTSAEQLAMHPLRFGLGRVGEYIAHADNFVAQKTFGQKTALEDWERKNVYGTTFPQWQNPIESYINPMVYKASQRNPLMAAATLGAAGALFGRTPRAKLFGSVLGSATGLTASLLGSGVERLKGERFIPQERRKELAVEEYSDILNYVKNTRLASMSQASGDYKAAAQYTSAAKRTMYGADIYGGNIETLSLAVPKRKREHFKAMINAPQEDRSKILSTAGRLERRIYEAAWGMDVEKLPDLNDYFTRHELPDEGWEGWHPNTNMDHVKIKTGQSMGLDMSQMGYYPQQIKEANLTNPSYPSFFAKNDRTDIQYRLNRLMTGMGITGTVTPVMTPFGNNRIDISAGVR